MISRRFFVVRPTAKLQAVIQRFGIEPDAVRPELLVKKNTSRHGTREDDDVALIKANYARVFLADLFGGSHSDWYEFAKEIETPEFNALWSIEVFDDCEDIDSLFASKNVHRE